MKAVPVAHCPNGHATPKWRGYGCPVCGRRVVVSYEQPVDNR